MSLVVGIDHLRISVSNLDAAMSDYQALLQPAGCWRGDLAGQPSALLALANVNLWLVETSTATGLDALCFAVTDIERCRRRLDRLGLQPMATATADPLSLCNPGVPRQTLSPDASRTRGLSLHLVASAGDTSKPTSSREGLDHLVIRSEDATRTGFLLGAQLGLDLRLDLEREDWDARLLFFRCGDLIVEVAQGLRSGSTGASDRDLLYGLSWRVSDAQAAHDRLGKAGIDVSEVRPGRKPGTRVMTVRSGSAGVPTLLIEPAA